MRRIVSGCLLCLLGVPVGCAGSPPVARDPAIGWWRGWATFRGARLELGVHFFRERDGVKATLSCPDMMILDQPLDDVHQAGRQIRFATRDERPLRFGGELAGDSIRAVAPVGAVPSVVESRPGSESSMQLELRRAPAPPAPPYSTRNVRFTAGTARLAGTLLVPASAHGRNAGVVILQGSSFNLRREYLFQADHFARAGFVVLSFDKRGAGESSGDYDAASYDDLAGDAAAAVECLRSQPEVDSLRVGLWGLSQGAFIAPRVAARVPSLRFIVAVSAPGMPVGESAIFQDSVRLASAGFGVTEVRRALSLNRRLLAWLRGSQAGDELAALLARASDTPWRRASSLPARLPAGAALEGWYWRGRTSDPAPWWSAVRAPVLGVYGAADELVPAGRSAELIERALRVGGNRDVTMRVFASANHELRTLPLVAGGPWDWPRAAPGYLDFVTTWMLAHSHRATR